MNTSPQPLVSICIAAYNAERHLTEALRSILDQTYGHLEVVLADDASTDRTFEVAQSVRDERFRCFRLPKNVGGYQAMNLVAQEARGDFVAIFHADDVYEPAIVEKEVAYLLSHPAAGAVFTMYHMMDEDGRIYGGTDLLPALAGRDLLTYEDVFPQIVRLGNVMFATPTFMVRREVLADVGPFEADQWDIVADLEMWLRLIRRYPVGILNQRLLRYRHGRFQWTQRWRHMRTAPNRALDIIELYVEKDHWRDRLPAADLVELRYQYCDDATSRAANAAILGEVALARQLLRGRYPYQTLLNGVRRRKVRVLLLRGLMKSALAVGAARPLGRLLDRTEHAGRR
jgi:glycosyltransferase involved in cell wall biosynthesis